MANISISHICAQGVLCSAVRSALTRSHHVNPLVLALLFLSPFSGLFNNFQFNVVFIAYLWIPSAIKETRRLFHFLDDFLPLVLFVLTFPFPLRLGRPPVSSFFFALAFICHYSAEQFYFPSPSSSPFHFLGRLCVRPMRCQWLVFLSRRDARRRCRLSRLPLLLSLTTSPFIILFVCSDRSLLSPPASFVLKEMTESFLSVGGIRTKQIETKPNITCVSQVIPEN